MNGFNEFLFFSLKITVAENISHNSRALVNDL
jgi:hypothetical protein